MFQPYLVRYLSPHVALHALDALTPYSLQAIIRMQHKSLSLRPTPTAFHNDSCQVICDFCVVFCAEYPAIIKKYFYLYSSLINIATRDEIHSL